MDEEKTIYDFGFGKSLNKDLAKIDSPLVYDSINGSTQAQSVQFGAIVAGAQNSIFIADPSKGIWLGDADFADAPFAVNMNGDLRATSATLSGVPVITQGSFGGDGSDGALSITSGTTTIDLSNASSLIKNYTSISITGTGALAFSNPHASGSIIILKSQGNVTITSSTAPCIDLRGMGASGGAGGAFGASGTTGTTGALIVTDSNLGGVGGSISGTSPGAGGGRWSNITIYTASTLELNRKAIFVACGSGGGGGGGGSSAGAGTGGDGARGGGALYIECGGALNFTTSNGISTKGSTGSNGTSSTSGGGGGGGGGAGSVVILYKTLTASSGTIDNSGGTGGNGANGSAGVGGSGGGGGGSYGGAGGTGGSGGGGGSAGGGGGGGAGVGGAGSDGASNGGGGTGGAGGAGGSASSGLVTKNTVFQ